METRLEKPTKLGQARYDILDEINSEYFGSLDEMGNPSVDMSREDLITVVDKVIGKFMLDNLINKKEAKKRIR